MNKPKYIVVHHTGGTQQDPLANTAHHTFEMVNAYHRGLWNFRSSLGHYMGYHYFIDQDGKLTQARANTDEGAHCIGKNKTSIGICLAGNFDLTTPTKAQTETLKTLLEELTAEYEIPVEKVLPHRHFRSTHCFGKNLADDWAQRLLLKEEITEESVSIEEATIEELLEQISFLLQELNKRIGGGGS